MLLSFFGFQEMEERRRILGKSPDIPIPVPRPLPFGSPSNAFHMPSSGSVFNIVISPETKMVNLNVPSIMEVGAGFSPPHNKFSRSAPSTTIQQIPTLDQVLAREITDGCNVRRLRRWFYFDSILFYEHLQGNVFFLINWCVLVSEPFQIDFLHNDQEWRRLNTLLRWNKRSKICR